MSEYAVISKITMNIRNLEELGIDRKTAKVYLACLEIGSGTALEISKKVGLPKSTTFDLLKSLVSKGLASTYLKKNRKYFSASDPSVIGDKIDKQKKIFEQVLPDLEAISHSGVGRPIVRYYDTKVGIGIALKEMFTEAKSLIFYGNANAAMDAYPEHFPGAAETRAKHKIPSRGIVTPGPDMKEFLENDKKTMRKTYILADDKDVKSFSWSWNDKIVIFNTIGDHSVVIIEDRRMAKLFQGMFEYMWETLNK